MKQKYLVQPNYVITLSGGGQAYADEEVELTEQEAADLGPAVQASAPPDAVASYRQ